MDFVSVLVGPFLWVFIAVFEVCRLVWLALFGLGGSFFVCGFWGRFLEGLGDIRFVQVFFGGVGWGGLGGIKGFWL